MELVDVETELETPGAGGGRGGAHVCPPPPSARPQPLRLGHIIQKFTHHYKFR